MTGAVERPRRGRPRTTRPASGLDPREEILRAAARLFSTNGVSGTRLADIARAIGVRTPAIYYHFENKDAIVEALLRYVVDDSAAYATTARSAAGSPATRLTDLVARHVTRLTSGPYDLWFVVGPSQAASDDYPAVARKVARWRRAVGALVADGTQSGELDDIDPQVAVAAISGVVYSALQLRHDGRPVDAGLFGRLAVRMLAAT